MNEKKPAYRITLPLAIALFVGGCIMISSGKDMDSLQTLGTVCMLGGIFMIVVSFISSIKVTIRNRKTCKEAQYASNKDQTIRQDKIQPFSQATVSTVKPTIVTTDKPDYKVEAHKVAGVSFRKKEIESIGVYNNDYDLSKSEIEDVYGTYTKVWQYEFDATAKLVPEPDNPHGENTIRVEADGVHIGYIKSGSSAHIKKLIDNNLIHSIEIEIGGGRYKMVTEDEDDDGNVRTRLEKGSTDYGYYAKLTLEVCPSSK